MKKISAFSESGIVVLSMASHSQDKWVVEVENSLRQPLESEGSDDIYGRVPDSLKKKNTRIFYVPQAVSFGPYHFRRKGPLHDEAECLKSEVARKYYKHHSSNDLWKRLVEYFKEENTKERIRKIYGKGFPREIGDDVFSLMMVRDGCFLFEILEQSSKEEDGENNGRERQNSTTSSIDRILDRRRYHPLLNDIVKDMFKMENQLPLWVLQAIVGERLKPNLVWLAFKHLSPIEVNIEEDNPLYNVEHHILQLLHDYMVDKDVKVDSGSMFEVQDADKMKKQCSKRSSQKTCPSVLSVITVIWRVVKYAFIALILSPVLILFFVWFILCLIWGFCLACITDEEATEETHIPTLEELMRLGVNFKKFEGRGIYHIEFNKNTLYLPKFKVDDRSEIILRNLIALEIYSGDVEKPITRYASLMNDLVNTSTDVAILRKYSIITSKLGSDNDVAQLWNSVNMATEMPTCQPIDRAALRVNRYCKNRLKVLWAQFKMLHCSKPWLMLSMLGGISLLLLTVVQVACLFRDCEYHRNSD